jgi:DNA-binding LacI/PurR family transcriptional regulator
MTPPADAPHPPRFVAVLMTESDKILNDRLYYGPMLQGLNDGLMERHFFMRPVQCLHEYQREHFLHANPRFYRGAVFIGPVYSFEYFVRAVAQTVAGPKVMLDHHLDDPAIHSVREDAVAGMRMLTGHLLALGHRHVAYLDNERLDANPWKRQGVDQALRAAGLPGLERGWTAGCRMNFGDTATALDWFLGLEPRPTAVVCADDFRALFLLQAAAERGLRVPQDLSIAGFGDLGVRSGRSHQLTSVGTDPMLLGRRAAELAAGAEDAPQVAALIPPELQVRGTTGRPLSSGRPEQESR